MNDTTNEQGRGPGIEGQRVIVVGGSSGLGLGIARACLSQGARAILMGRSADRLERARRELAALGEVATFAGDVAEEAAVARLFDATGPVDHVVMTAADLAYRPVRELDLRAAERIVAVKLLGALLLAKHGRLRAGGSLTFTSGIAAYRPAPRGALVAAVNAALGPFAGALALELAPVRVNVVSPGWIDTPIWDGFAGEKKHELLADRAARLPVRRNGTPEDVARAVLFLMESGFVTGTVLEVDGGHRWA